MTNLIVFVPFYLADYIRIFDGLDDAALGDVQLHIATIDFGRAILRDRSASAYACKGDCERET
jgi:hypothetical protein